MCTVIDKILDDNGLCFRQGNDGCILRLGFFQPSVLESNSIHRLFPFADGLIHTPCLVGKTDTD